MESVGNEIRRARKAAGMTQDDLARALRLNRATISKYESGAIDPTIGQFIDIARLLKVDVYAIMDFDTASEALSERINQDIDIYGEYYHPLLSAFQKLNEEGKREAVKRLEELSEVSRYKAGNENA